MIDIDKYEGHSKTIKTGSWKRSDKVGFKSESVFDESGKKIASVKLAGYDIKRVNETYANLLLIADAPKLLAEVKRLRRQIKVAQGVFEHLYDDELEDASWIRWFCNMEDEEE